MSAPPAEKEFHCHISVTLERDQEVISTSYTEEYEPDENGMMSPSYDTTHVDWNKEYTDNAITIPDMMRELASYVKREMVDVAERSLRGAYLKRILAATQGWEVTNLEVEAE